MTLEKKPASTRAGRQPSANRTGTDAALITASMFWQPVYEGETPWLLHVPFLYWLVDNTKPRQVVCTSVRDAAGPFAICQAIDKLGFQSQCQVYFCENLNRSDLAAAAEHNKKFYASFCELVSDAQAQRAGETNSASVDLLLIDSTHSVDQLNLVLDDWLPRLSDQAVVLVHGINDCAEGRVTSIETLGERMPEAACRVMPLGDGLCVLAPKGRVAETLQRFFHGVANDSGVRLFLDALARLAQACDDRQVRSAMARLQDRAESTIQALTLETDMLRERINRKERTEESLSKKQQFIVEETTTLIGRFETDNKRLNEKIGELESDRAERQVRLNALLDKAANVAQLEVESQTDAKLVPTSELADGDPVAELESLVSGVLSSLLRTRQQAEDAKAILTAQIESNAKIETLLKKQEMTTQRKDELYRILQERLEASLSENSKLHADVAFLQAQQAIESLPRPGPLSTHAATSVPKRQIAAPSPTREVGVNAQADLDAIIAPLSSTLSNLFDSITWKTSQPVLKAMLSPQTLGLSNTTIDELKRLNTQLRNWISKNMT